MRSLLVPVTGTTHSAMRISSATFGAFHRGSSSKVILYVFEDSLFLFLSNSSFFFLTVVLTHRWTESLPGIVFRIDSHCFPNFHLSKIWQCLFPLQVILTLFVLSVLPVQSFWATKHFVYLLIYLLILRNLQMFKVKHSCCLFFCFLWALCLLFSGDF